MGNSTLDPDNTPLARALSGHDARAPDPSDSSDSGSDTVHAWQQALEPLDEVDQHAPEQGEVGVRELDLEADDVDESDDGDATGDDDV